MTYLIVFVAALVAAAFFVLRRKRNPPSVAAPVSRSRKPKETERTPAFAERHVNGRYHPMTSEQVDSLLAPYKEETRAWKSFARKLTAHEKRASASGKLNEKLIAEARALLPAVQGRAGEFAAVVDDLFFARESSSKIAGKDVDALKAVEAELSIALGRLDNLKAAISDKSFVPLHAAASEQQPARSKDALTGAEEHVWPSRAGGYGERRGRGDVPRLRRAAATQAHLPQHYADDERDVQSR